MLVAPRRYRRDPTMTSQGNGSPTGWVHIADHLHGQAFFRDLVAHVCFCVWMLVLVGGGGGHSRAPSSAAVSPRATSRLQQKAGETPQKVIDRYGQPWWAGIGKVAARPKSEQAAKERPRRQALTVTLEKSECHGHSCFLSLKAATRPTRTEKQRRPFAWSIFMDKNIDADLVVDRMWTRT